MSSEPSQGFSNPSATGTQGSDGGRDRDTGGTGQQSSSHETTVLVRGESIRDPLPQQPGKESRPKDSQESQPKDKEKPAQRQVSESEIKLQQHLPALDDDAQVGIEKQQIVVRDGKADLAFTGTLLASAAPPSAPSGQWQEYRIYATNGGKHVFSKVKRSVFLDEQNTHEAEVFDPNPASVPSQLLRSARELARSRPMTWMDAAAAYFGYDPLAKILYRKLGGQFEEHIT
jgi:hypothetical protein